MRSIILFVTALSCGLITYGPQSRADDAAVVDADGNTPLGAALGAGQPEVARRWIDAMSPAALRHRNNAGEGYVFLAARAGYPNLITALAQAQYQTLGALGRFNFSRLDRKTAVGQRALFVAANRDVAETLEAQHYRGFLKYPWRDFMLERDKLGQNFLHAAARDGRDDVILWATERLCPAGSWERSKHWLLRWPAWTAAHGLAAAQTYVIGDVRMWWDQMVNRPDKQHRTPLHVAIENKRWGSVRALAHCRWTDFDVRDRRGDLPLHTFLTNTDPELAEHAPETHDAFDFLAGQDSRLRLRTLTMRATVRNREGQTPLHLAARLADPYFYRRLARVGDVLVKDRQGQTAEQIFARHQAQVHQNGD